MAGCDDQTVEVGMIEERGLCVLAGDDNEDDMRGDREALFSCRADDPINVDGTDDPPAPPLDVTTLSAHVHSTSIVWHDFEKLFKNINGKRVRYGAKCLYCSKEYYALSSGGFCHLSRHIAVCVKKRERLACLGLKSLLILMVVCIVRTIVL